MTVAFGLTALVAFVAFVRAQIRRDLPNFAILAAVGGTLIASGCVASLTLLIANWSSRIPFHNFRPTGADDLLYALWCIYPLLVLGFLIFFTVIGVRHRSARQRATEVSPYDAAAD